MAKQVVQRDRATGKKPVIFIDNISAIKLAKNPSFHKRSKHIAVRYHFVREYIETDQLMIEYVPNERQVADILTKPIPRVQYEKFRDQLGLKYSYKLCLFNYLKILPSKQEIFVQYF